MNIFVKCIVLASFDPFERMNLVLSTPDMPSNAISQSIERVVKQVEQVRGKKAKSDGSASPLFVLAAPYLIADQPNKKADEQKNEVLKQQFNGLTFQIGQRLEFLTNRLGTPISAKHEGERSIYVFGGAAPPRAKVPFSWLQAVFIDGKLSYLFSHNFLDPAMK